MTTPKVTQVEVDRALAMAQARLAQLGPALLELDEDKRRRAPEAASLRGASAASWATNNDQMSVLWACFQALSEALEAMAARRNAPRARDRDLAAIWEDLSTPSVTDLRGRRIPGPPLLPGPGRRGAADRRDPAGQPDRLGLRAGRRDGQLARRGVGHGRARGSTRWTVPSRLRH